MPGGSTTFAGIFGKLVDVLALVVPVLGGAATIVFIYGVVKFIAAAGNPDKRNDAKSLIVYGLAGLFVLFSFWGIVKLLLNTLFGGGTPPSPDDWSWFKVY